MQQIVIAYIKLTFKDDGHNFKKTWWAGVDVEEPTVWYYPCYTNEEVFENLQMFNEWPLPLFEEVAVQYEGG